MTYSDYGQIAGSVFILAGYWLRAKDVKWASIPLIIGCVIFAAWAATISPPAWWMCGLEVILGAMSARTLYLNWRA
jgi:hypothetical protein